jgi:hypothetical protein
LDFDTGSSDQYEKLVKVASSLAATASQMVSATTQTFKPDSPEIKEDDMVSC